MPDCAFKKNTKIIMRHFKLKSELLLGTLSDLSSDNFSNCPGRSCQDTLAGFPAALTRSTVDIKRRYLFTFAFMEVLNGTLNSFTW